jgi:hypothetical protein
MGNTKTKNIKKYKLLTVRFSLDGLPFVSDHETFWINYTGKVFLVVVSTTSSEFLYKIQSPHCIPLQDFYNEEVFLYLPIDVEIRHLSPRETFLGVVSESHDVLEYMKKRSLKWKVYFKGDFSTHPQIDGVVREKGKIDKRHLRIVDNKEIWI